MADWISKIGSVVINALVGAAAALSAYFWMPAKDKAELDLKFFDVAFKILNNNVTCQRAVRTWAVQILNSHSPREAQMSSDAQKELIGEGCESPKLAATLPQATSTAPQTSGTGLTDQISVLESQGLDALLNKNLPIATNRFSAAYQLWPIYRNTDEIQRFLRARASKPPADEAEWKAIYSSVAKCDLFGADAEVLDKLAKAVGLADSRAMALQVDSKACGK